MRSLHWLVHNWSTRWRISQLYKYHYFSWEYRLRNYIFDTNFAICHRWEGFSLSDIMYCRLNNRRDVKSKLIKIATILICFIRFLWILIGFPYEHTISPLSLVDAIVQTIPATTDGRLVVNVSGSWRRYCDYSILCVLGTWNECCKQNPYLHRRFTNYP